MTVHLQDRAIPTTEINSTQPGIRTERGADRTMPYLLGFRHGSLASSRGQTLLLTTYDDGAARKRGGAYRLTAHGRTRPPDGTHPVMGLLHCRTTFAWPVNSTGCTRGADRSRHGPRDVVQPQQPSSV